MKTAIIAALFGALALTACGDKKAPETTNPDAATPAPTETTPPAEGEKTEEKTEEKAEEAEAE